MSTSQPPINASPEIKLKYQNKKIENEIDQLQVANQNLFENYQDYIQKTELKKTEIQQTAEQIEKVNEEIVGVWASLGDEKGAKRRAKSKPAMSLYKTELQ